MPVDTCQMPVAAEHARPGPRTDEVFMQIHVLIQRMPFSGRPEAGRFSYE